MANEAEGGKPRVFVYGSLKKGYGNHYLLTQGGAVYLGEQVITGEYRLIDFGWYPGLVRLDGGEPVDVHGEVYEVSTETLAAMDLLEGHPTFYCRSKVDTDFKKAWCYFLPESYADEAPEVEGGNWRG